MTGKNLTKTKTIKETLKVQTRKPKQGGIFDNYGKDRQKVKHPFDEMIDFGLEKPVIHSEMQAVKAVSSPISPIRDFTKVPNSIARQAIPERLFRGMSKNTYDAFYRKTRGAIVPQRKIRATKSDLLRWTGVSDVTLDKHIKHLKSVGLLKIEFMRGSHEGNWYEIVIPEEINSVDIDDSVQDPDDQRGLSALSIKSIDSTNQKNEEFAGFINTFQTAAEELTGKKLSMRDAENLQRLAELLVLELRVAARRTNNISSLPAFLTEVLRRKLTLSPTSLKTHKKNRSQPGFHGKPVAGQYEIKPLSAEEKESVLYQLREFAEEDFLEDFKKWYTTEDWDWIMQRIK